MPNTVVKMPQLRRVGLRGDDRPLAEAAGRTCRARRAAGRDSDGQSQRRSAKPGGRHPAADPAARGHDGRGDGGPGDHWRRGARRRRRRAVPMRQLCRLLAPPPSPAAPRPPASFTYDASPGGGVVGHRDEPALSSQPEAPEPNGAPAKRFYTPVVLRMAEEHHIDLSTLAGHRRARARDAQGRRARHRRSARQPRPQRHRRRTSTAR